jgi:hypothetical protein
MKLIKHFVVFVSSLSILTGCETAFEPDLRDKQVTLISPVNNISTTDTIQTFYWEILDGATEYQLQIVSPRFDSVARLIEDTITGKNTFLIDLDTNNYQWRVRAINSSTFSDYSEIRKLHIY